MKYNYRSRSQFIRFPNKGSLKYEKWAKNLLTVPNNTYRIFLCKNHFSKEDFDYDERLKTYACPSVEWKNEFYPVNKSNTSKYPPAQKAQKSLSSTTNMTNKKRCLIKTCASATTNDMNCKYIRFPEKGSAKYIEWIIALGLDASNCGNLSGYLCEKHFRREDFKFGCLQSEAVPTYRLEGTENDLTLDDVKIEPEDEDVSMSAGGSSQLYEYTIAEISGSISNEQTDVCIEEQKYEAPPEDLTLKEVYEQYDNKKVVGSAPKTPDSSLFEEIRIKNEPLDDLATENVSLLTITNKTLHKCSACNNVYKNNSSLRRHMIVHANKEHQCHHCSELFLRKVQVKEHLFLHFQVEKYKCPECEQSFLKYAAFYRHLAKHSARYQCYHCPANYLGKWKLLQHLGKHFVFLSNFVCSICAKRFLTAKTLQRHATCHSDSRNFKCHICRRAFKAQRHLNAHILTHSQEKNHICSICDKRFLVSTNLRVHMRTHSDIKKFKCHHCNAGFRLKQHIVKHMSLHFCRECLCAIPEKPKTHLCVAHGSGNKKRYKCNQCSAVFSKLVGLSNHQAVHNRSLVEQQFLKCDRKYPNRKALREHAKIHEDRSFCQERKFETSLDDSYKEIDPHQ